MAKVYQRFTRIVTRNSINVKRIHCGTGTLKQRSRIAKTSKSADNEKQGSKKKGKRKKATIGHPFTRSRKPIADFDVVVIIPRELKNKSDKSTKTGRRGFDFASGENFEYGVPGGDTVPKTKPKKRKATVDDGVHVYQVKCSRGCFPLLDYHSNLFSDIVTKYQKVQPLIKGVKHVGIPNIAQSEELLFTVVTNGKISEDLPLIVRKQNVGSTTCTDITEKSHVSNTIQEAKGSLCCLVFEHSDISSDIQAEVILRISSQTSRKAPRTKNTRVIESDMTEQTIRKSLTHCLGDPLFSYAEKISEILKKLSENSKEEEQNRLVEQAIQATHALLNRKDKSRPSKSPERGRIPENVSMGLNKLAKDGVLAFGCFPNGLLVLLDENITEQKRRRKLQDKVKKVCDQNGMSPRMEFTSKSFLTPTAVKQDGKLKNKATGQVGTLGMVTRAQDRRKPKDEQKTVVGLTSGHYFEEGNIAVGYMDTENKTETDLGKCIASLQTPTDVAVIKISESDKYSFNFCDENNRLCNCIPMQQEMKLHDVVYKRGAQTGLTKGYIRSHDFRVSNHEDASPLGRPEEGYFIEGDEEKMFAVQGDSGSVVFFPDLEDMEKETVQIVSIQSKSFPDEIAKILGIPPNISYTVRADRCFDKLRDEKSIELELPTKHDMQ